jgi:hypothetical protein
MHGGVILMQDEFDRRGNLKSTNKSLAVMHKLAHNSKSKNARWMQSLFLEGGANSCRGLHQLQTHGNKIT